MFTGKWAKVIAKRIGMEYADDHIAHIILEGLNNNKGGCPCIMASMRTKDHNCPCKDARENKKCKCGLFNEKFEDHECSHSCEICQEKIDKHV